MGNKGNALALTSVHLYLIGLQIFSVAKSICFKSNPKVGQLLLPMKILVILTSFCFYNIFVASLSNNS